jgi:hypothetical protein
MGKVNGEIVQACRKQSDIGLRVGLCEASADLDGLPTCGQCLLMPPESRKVSTDGVERRRQIRKESIRFRLRQPAIDVDQLLPRGKCMLVMSKL